MSRVIERLQLLAKATAEPMGFRTAATPKNMAMMLIASLSQPDAEAAAIAAKADAVLIYQENLSSQAQSLHQMIQAIGDTPWGVYISGEVGKEEISQLVEMGCDFLVFAAAVAPISVLQQKGIGKILELESPQDECLLGIVDHLPLDAVLVRGDVEGNPFLTVQSLMICHHFANLLRKPLLLTAHSDLPNGDLEALWTAGVDGVVWDTEGVNVKKRLPQLRKVIEGLPPGAKRRRAMAEVLLPYTGGVVEEEVEEE
jgi:hypothetical protein